MGSTWIKNIDSCAEIIEENKGPRLVTIVSGSQDDRAYWEEHCAQTKADIYRADGETQIVSVLEQTRKGNFLGTLNAWQQIVALGAQRELKLPPTMVINMLFGMGKRLSPFTQALMNRKPAFPTPRKGARSQRYLQMADLSGFSNNLLVRSLERGGFQGCVVKWGDEAIIPGVDLLGSSADYRGFHAIRVASRREITPELAREKEWIVFHTASNSMHSQHARQPFESLVGRLEQYNNDSYTVAVNLGTTAVSYSFLETALEVFGAELADPQVWLDWDPYFWMAIYCEDAAAWQREREHEARIGASGIAQLEGRCPDFYLKVAAFRRALEQKTGTPLAVGVIDFGEILWADFGLHLAMRSNLESMLDETPAGQAYRRLFGIDASKDARGNIIVRSTIAKGAQISNSIIIDSVIGESASRIDRGVIVNGRFGSADASQGGIAISSAARRLVFAGPHGLAFQSIDDELLIPEGGRHTTLALADRVEHMRSSEGLASYEGDNYAAPVLGNRLSFAEAAAAMAGDPLARQRWLELWEKQLDTTG